MTKNRFQVCINGQFQRSKRLDADTFDAGYVLLGTARQALEIMSRNIETGSQRAFTWTGSYGCGKSSLALFLSSVVASPQERARAREMVGDDAQILSGFTAKDGWKVLRLVGRQGDLLEDVGSLLKCRRTEKAVCSALQREAETLSIEDGVLLIIDELGKYLEADCASANTYLLQELAEFVCRSDRKIVIIGILHQAMDAYAAKLPFSVRDEWAKVQGRFVDIPLTATTDETLELLSRAILHPDQYKVSDSFAREVEVAATWMRQYAGFDMQRMQTLLTRCAPLNPVVALMLGPVSRRKFSQNERSIYSFLSAMEPSGFADFLGDDTAGDEYRLSNFFDYLQSNFESSILSTNDAHRWMIAVDAINRAELKGSRDLLNLAKAVAVIDLFRTGTKIQASVELLSAAVGAPISTVKKQLAELVSARVLIERKHANSWAVFAGSDFDLEAAMKEAAAQVTDLDISSVEHLVKLDPVVARSHYFKKGTMRWFNRRVVSEVELSRIKNEKFADEGSSGEMVLVIPSEKSYTSTEGISQRLERLYAKECIEEVAKKKSTTFILGIPLNAQKIRNLSLELQAINIVAKDPVLEGDETGRNEVNLRRSFIRQELSDELGEAFATACWLTPYGIKQAKTQIDLVELVSSVCDKLFCESPKINNELINRDHLSGNITSARKELMRAMVIGEEYSRLGFEKFPPAYALYATILSTLHVKSQDNKWRFLATPEQNGDVNNFSPLWKATTEFIKKREIVSLQDIYNQWRRVPYGIKFGPMPILLIAYLLGNLDHIAIYSSGSLVSKIEDYLVDEILVSPKEIKVRYVDEAAYSADILNSLAKALSKFGGNVSPTPLGVGKAIVEIIFTAPVWAQKTQNMSQETLELRRVTMKASDPIDFVLHKIPEVFGSNDPVILSQKLITTINEYLEVTPRLYESIKQHLFEALQVAGANLEDLHKRAKAIKGLSGNMTQEAFVTRMELFKGTDADMQGLWSLTTGKPMNLCSDLSLQVCFSKIDEFAFAFRQQEAFAALRGRQTRRTVLGITVASGDNDIVRSVELTDDVRDEARNIAEKMLTGFKKLDKNLAYAVLAELGILINKAR